MLFYIFPYLFVFFCTLYFYGKQTSEEGKIVVLFFTVFPALLVAVLRGDVGTDTYFYLNSFREYRLFGESGGKFEPGFEFLIWLIAVFLGADERLGVALIAVLTTVLLCISFSKSRYGNLLFGLVLFPLFYVDFTMNGLRYGLAFSLAAISVDNLYEKKYVPSIVLAIGAMIVQYSSILVVLVFAMDLLKKRYWILIWVLVGAFVFAFADMISLMLLYLEGKQTAYSNSYSPTAFSGIAPLFVTIALYFVFLRNSNGKHSSLITLILLLEAVSFVVSRYTYAGLRFQGVFMFAMILYLKNNWMYLQNKKRHIIGLVLISILAFMILLKNVRTALPEDMSPFLPYHFFWEANEIRY